MYPSPCLQGYFSSYQSFVCSDFGSIFAELLPGNFAKLQPPEGQDLTDGLEVKVRLGSVWKQSLTELSGGQRWDGTCRYFEKLTCLLL